MLDGGYFPHPSTQEKPPIEVPSKISKCKRQAYFCNGCYSKELEKATNDKNAREFRKQSTETDRIEVEFAARVFERFV